MVSIIIITVLSTSIFKILAFLYFICLIYQLPLKYYTCLLQSFLNTFDAVVVGDGSFEFVRSLVDDVLQLPPSAAAGGWQAGRAARGLFGRPLGGFFSSGGSSISGSNGGNGNREGGVRGI